MSEQWFVASRSCGQDYQCQNNGLLHRVPVDRTVSVRTMVCCIAFLWTGRSSVISVVHRVPVDRTIKCYICGASRSCGQDSQVLYLWCIAFLWTGRSSVISVVHRVPVDRTVKCYICGASRSCGQDDQVLYLWCIAFLWTGQSSVISVVHRIPRLWTGWSQ